MASGPLHGILSCSSVLVRESRRASGPPSPATIPVCGAAVAARPHCFPPAPDRPHTVKRTKLRPMWCELRVPEILVSPWSLALSRIHLQGMMRTFRRHGLGLAWRTHCLREFLSSARISRRGRSEFSPSFTTTWIGTQQVRVTGEHLHAPVSQLVPITDDLGRFGRS